MRSSRFVKRSILVSAFLLLIIFSTPARSQGTEVTLSSPNASINNAFSSVYQAERNGGNVSALVQQLNAAILLVQKAEAENSTNPSLATADLESASEIAQRVSEQSISVSTAGSESRLAQLYESIAVVTASVFWSTLAYSQWDHVYRQLWFLIYRKHVVIPNDE